MTTLARSGLVLVLLLTPALACAHPRARDQPLTPVAELAEPRASHSATLLAGGGVLIAGGFRKGPDGYSQLYSSTTEIVDADGAVRPGPSLVHARAGHVAASLPDGRILLAGGWDDAGLLRSAEVYDPATDGFAAVGDMAAARGAFTATTLADGRVLVCGGGEGTAVATAELFDPADDTFHPTGAMVTARLGHTATLLADGTVLIAGGAGGRDDVLASAELYDPATGAFTATGDLAVARYKHGSIRLADDRVLVVGGSNARDWRGKYASTEVYDPATGAFTAGPKLRAARFKMPHALALLPDGDVAVAGGATAVERIHVGARSRAIARLGHASYYGTVTAAGDRLVVVGGYDDHVQSHTQVWVLRL